MKNNIISYFDSIIPNPRCELNYTKDYELLIAVVLSAQCTDKRVNLVTSKLFSKYDLSSLAKANIKDIEKILYELGNYHKKSEYVINIAKKLLKDYDGKVPNDGKYLESLPGVGHKTASVVLAELFNVPTIAVDTHVERVSKRLYIAKENDSIKTIEKKLKKFLNKEEYNRVNHQLVLFGRYYCKAVKPLCEKCPLKCRVKD
jgi:endonuclease-3